MLAQSSSSSSSYLVFVLLTIATWGLYGIFLHKGQVEFADPLNGRYKAFLFVGIAYFLVAVLAPMGMLLITGADWKMTSGGMGWSLIAGIVGAVGAFGVLLAFGGGGQAGGGDVADLRRRAAGQRGRGDHDGRPMGPSETALPAGHCPRRGGCLPGRDAEAQACAAHQAPDGRAAGRTRRA